MTPPRFFYSTDGTDAHGPVTEDELRQLVHNRVLGPASFLCPEGQTAWQPINPELLRSASPPILAPPPPPPFSPPPYVHTAESIARAEALSQNEWEEESSTPAILKAIGWIVALIGSILLALLGGPGPNPDLAISYRLGGFTAGLLISALLPFLISLAFKDPIRAIVRLAGISILALLMIVGKLSRPNSRFEATAHALDEKVQAEAQKEIAAKGYFDGSTQEAEQNLQVLRDQATGDSQTARIARDMLDLTHNLLALVKTSDDAEKACVFDPGTITSLDDITQRRTSINKLRDAQAEVVTFLQDYDSHCRDALAHDNFDASVVSATIAGARKGSHVDLLVTLWQDKIKLSDDHLSRLDFLQKNWGKWEAKDGKLLFQDDTTLAAYNVYVQTLKSDVKEMGEMQKQIFQ
jgi:hypothetical protein